MAYGYLTPVYLGPKLGLVGCMKAYMLLGAIDLLNTCRLKLPAENVVTQISLRTDGIRVSNASLDVSKDRIFYLE